MPGESLKAVVMAGGEGSRLRPITANRPKPLVPICNRPIMEHILTLLKQHGVKDVVSTLFYLSDEIQSYFGDGSEFDVKMSYSIEDTPLGTAGSVKKAEDLLKDDTFFIVSGDALTDCDLTKALEFHRAKKSLATIILYRVPSPLEFGVVITDDDGKIVRFLEKPSWSEVFSDTVNTGMYILEPEIFQYMDPDKPYDWSGDIFPYLLQQGKPLYGYVMDEYWTDVGSLTQYREAQEDLLSGRVNLPVPGKQANPGVYLDLNCTIDEGVELVPPICIGRNCKVKRGARIGPYTVLGDNCFIEEDATVERSVIWDSGYIGPKVSVQSSIICSRVTVKKDSQLKEDSVIGDRCLIDVGSTIRPRIKLWPDKVVERGSTVTMSLVWGNKWRGSLFRELGVAGLSNIEITPDFACRLGAAYASQLPAHSKVVCSRDSTRSSRMIKRAVISSVLSAGCDVLDLQGAPAPVVRHFTKTGAAVGAIHTRKLPGNSRVTLVEMFDSRGSYLSRGMERKVETAFFREDFRRADPDELGVIEVSSRAVEAYQTEFFRLIKPEPARKRLRLVCDYGYSSLAGFYPVMLSRFNVDSISLNSYNDAKIAPRSKDEVQRHLENLRGIVNTLGYDMGVLFRDDGERLTIIDQSGEVVEGNRLLAVLALLVGQTHPEAIVAMSVTAPGRLEQMLSEDGVKVIRTKADTRSLMNTSLEAQVTFAGDESGGFIFPEMHPGFDAPFTFGMLISMLQQSQHTLSELLAEIPPFHMAYEQVRCPWEAKGGVMRRITEDSRTSNRVELVDGIKIFTPRGWVLVLPDSLEPVFHLHAEADDESASRALVREYAEKIERMQAVSVQ